MEPTLVRILTCLVVGIILIVLLTAKFRIHAFFALILASLLVGVGIGMPISDVLNFIKDGFGNILKALGLIIVLGTTLGVILEKTHATHVMADAILKIVGKKRAALAMSITGLIVGLPIFCDSGYIVLSGLNKTLAKSTGISVVVMAVSLATGLYSVHCLIPPHPGAAAAAGLLHVDFGRLIMWGIFAAIPAMLVGHFWARYAGKGVNIAASNDSDPAVEIKGPSAFRSFLPVVVPILLIAIKSFFVVDPKADGQLLSMLLVLGDPAIALAIGVLLACLNLSAKNKTELSHLLQEGAEKAGGILVIIGAGGAFGAVLAASKIGSHLSTALPLASLGLFFPFLITCMLKTAQGSSTVAIITAASIVLPLLSALGLDSENGRLLCILAMGAGSMMISHANDAYFWVIAKFSGLDMKVMLRVYSVATLWMGLTSILMVFIIAHLL